MNSQKSGDQGRNTFLDIALVIGLFVATLFFFAPINVLKGNILEFNSGLLDLLPPLTLLITFTLIVLGAVLLLVPRWLQTRLIALLLILSVLLYVQGNLLLWDYGQFDGNDIPWEHFFVHGLGEAVMWAVAIIAALTWAGRIRAVLLTLVSVLFAIQLMNLAVDSHRIDGLWRSESIDPPPQEIFSFSAQKNVLFVVLDAFQTLTFEAILEKDPKYRDLLDGFVYFADNTAALSTTAMSIPAMLSGEVYRNDLPKSQFLRRALGENSLPVFLHNNGYRPDMLALWRPYCPYIPSHIGCHKLVGLGAKDYVRVVRKELVRLLDLSLFRYLPHFAKQKIYADHKWLLQSIFYHDSAATPLQKGSVAAVNLFESLAASDSPVPTFKFIHLLLPHKPLVFSRKCIDFTERQLQDWSKDRLYEEQARCSLLLVEQLLEKMRELDVYDSSLIVIAADHGLGKRTYYKDVDAFMKGIQRARPLLLVKPIKASGLLRLSHNPSTLTDIPRTIAEELQLESNFPGESVFSVSLPRIRHYYHYVWYHKYWAIDYLPPLQEYEINGPAQERASWSMGPKLEGPEDSIPGQ